MRFLLALFALFCFAPTVNAQQAFEGRVHQKISVPFAPTLEMGTVMNIKGDKLMMEISMGPAGELKIFTQNGSPTMTSVIESNGIGYEMTMGPVISTASNESSTIHATGRKEKINGYAAEEWTAALDGGNTLSMWLTSEIDPSVVAALNTAMKAQDAQDPNETRSAVTLAIAKKNMAVVRTVIKANGVDQTIIDLVKIEKVALPDSTFQIPAGVTITKM